MNVNDYISTELIQFMIMSTAWKFDWQSKLEKINNGTLLLRKSRCWGILIRGRRKAIGEVVDIGMSQEMGLKKEMIFRTGLWNRNFILKRAIKRKMKAKNC